MSESEDVDRYEDASSETMIREAKDRQRRKLRAITFTSEVFQTLVDDQTTVYLGSTPSVFINMPYINASSRTANALLKAPGETSDAEVTSELDRITRNA